MGFGNYDDDEHEKREERLSIETSEETFENQHKGTVTTEGSTDTDALLDQLNDIREEKEKKN